MNLITTQKITTPAGSVTIESTTGGRKTTTTITPENSDLIEKIVEELEGGPQTPAVQYAQKVLADFLMRS